MREAALDLYGEYGYEATTTAQIAARAGVTERTYFRHFADKREVLFDGEEELIRTLADAIAAAEAGVGPLQRVIQAYVVAAPLFVKGYPVARRRAAIVDTSAALQERANAKSAALTDAILDALGAQGVPEATARLAALTGNAVFQHAYRHWDGATADELITRINHAADELSNLVGP